MTKYLTENHKNTCEEVHVKQRNFKDSTFLQVLLRDCAEAFQNAYERCTLFSDDCLKFKVIFHKIVIIFLGRNTPNNKFLDVTNK